MDYCEEVREYENGIEVIDIKDIPSWIRFDHFENSTSDEIDIFDMTSLNSLVFLSQRDNTGAEVITNEEENRLSLAYERLHIFPKALLSQFSLTVHTLDISYNEFDNLDFLKSFQALTTLICDHNNITSDTILPELPNLKLLWLNYCKITELYPWARHLRDSCPRLKYLSLMGNVAAPSYLNGGTFYEYLQYRLFMISLFPNLEHLDDRRVTKDQRTEAQKLYKRPFFERLSVKSSKVLPTYLRTVSDKLTNFFQPNLPFQSVETNKNIIV